MPMTMNSSGMEYYSDLISALGDKAAFVASQSLYVGAGLMAEEVTKAAKEIKTEPFKWAPPGQKRKPSPEEKTMVMAAGSAGIAKFEVNGSEINTSVGYNASGYAEVPWIRSRKARTNYSLSSLMKGNPKVFRISGSKAGDNPTMKPIGVIANSINSGTSFMEKQPFFRRAVTRGTKKAKDAIIQTAETLFDYIVQNKDIGGKTA